MFLPDFERVVPAQNQLIECVITERIGQRRVCRSVRRVNRRDARAGDGLPVGVGYSAAQKNDDAGRQIADAGRVSRAVRAGRLHGFKSYSAGFFVKAVSRDVAGRFADGKQKRSRLIENQRAGRNAARLNAEADRRQSRARARAVNPKRPQLIRLQPDHRLNHPHERAQSLHGNDSRA